MDAPLTNVVETEDVAANSMAGFTSVTARLLRFLRKLDHSILVAYVRLCPIASNFNYSTPGIPVLLLIALLPR